MVGDHGQVLWNGTIHTNTDNVHIHLAFVEREKVHRRFDRIDVHAFDKLKSTVYRQIYGDGKRHLWQNYKVNKETDFFARAGNAVLAAIKDSGLREEYQADKKRYADPLSSGSSRHPGAAYRPPRRSSGQSLDDLSAQRKSFFGLSRTADGVMRRSLHETRRHIRQLMAEYEREQNQKNARN